jgi:hypothetical protein
VCGPALSRNGERVAFVTWRGGRNVVVADGQAGDEFDSVSWPLALSADGRVVAYQAREGQDQFCVVGARKSRAYESVGLPVLSADGSVVAFAACDNDGWHVIRNGRKGPRFDWVGNLALHPSGDRLAYTAENREAGALRAFVVFDGVPGPHFSRVTPPVLSGDGNTVAYAGLRAGRWTLVVGQQELPVDGEVSRIFLSTDGGRVGYVLEDGSSRRLVAPSGPGPAFDWIGEAAFLKNGRIVYLASRGLRKFLATDDHWIHLGEGEFSVLTPSSDGSQVGVAVREGRSLSWKTIPIPRSGGHVAKEE